jgi:hypothetical protein
MLIYIIWTCFNFLKLTAEKELRDAAHAEVAHLNLGRYIEEINDKSSRKRKNMNPDEKARQRYSFLPRHHLLTSNVFDAHLLGKVVIAIESMRKILGCVRRRIW